MQILTSTSYNLPGGESLKIFGRDSGVLHPENGVVYDQAGKERFKVQAPVLKSTTMLNGIKDELHSRQGQIVWTVPPHLEKKKNLFGKVVREIPQQGYLYSCRGVQEIQGKTCAAVVVSDGGSYMELQFLDLDTGIFLKEAHWIGRL